MAAARARAAPDIEDYEIEPFMPGPVGDLFREAQWLEAEADRIFDQMVEQVPTTLAGVIEKLQRYRDNPMAFASAIAGLQSIGGASPTAPVE